MAVSIKQALSVDFCIKAAAGASRTEGLAAMFSPRGAARLLRALYLVSTHWSVKWQGENGDMEYSLQ